jgi:hypothetical protein
MLTNQFQMKNCNSDNNNHTTINSTRKKHQPSIHDRVKLIHIDDEYSGLTQGICGTIIGIYAANEICKSVNRPELIIWVKWDNDIELGLIEGVDKYEIVSGITTNNNIAQAAEQTVNSY